MPPVLDPGPIPGPGGPSRRSNTGQAIIDQADQAPTIGTTCLSFWSKTWRKTTAARAAKAKKLPIERAASGSGGGAVRGRGVGHGFAVILLWRTGASPAVSGGRVVSHVRFDAILWPASPPSGSPAWRCPCCGRAATSGSDPLAEGPSSAADSGGDDQPCDDDAERRERDQLSSGHRRPLQFECLCADRATVSGSPVRVVPRTRRPASVPPR